MIRFFFAILIALFSLHAEDYKIIEAGPIHEALASPRLEREPLRALDDAPPEQIEDKAPDCPDEDLIWIGGYWEYSEEFRDFIWVSGVWRKPPPGRIWIAGYWRYFPEGWVRVAGFWSKKEESELTYICKTPPEPVDEMTGAPPRDGFFWAKGYYSYSPDKREYHRMTGRWEKLDPKWVLVPSTYLWRSKGYVFVEPYWDWPLDERGIAYADVFIRPASRAKLVLLPQNVVATEEVIHTLFYHYPDYAADSFHHYHYNPRFWSDFKGTPTWWKWISWWTLSREQQWALFWWWGSTDYPAPRWLDEKIADLIEPPPAFIQTIFQCSTPPPIVTQNGVVSAGELLEEIANLGKTKKPRPILPSKPAQLQEIQKNAMLDAEVAESFDPKEENDAVATVDPTHSATEPKSQEAVLFDKPIEVPRKPPLSMREHERTLQSLPQVSMKPALQKGSGPLVQPEYFVPRQNREPYTTGPKKIVEAQPKLKGERKVQEQKSHIKHLNEPQESKSALRPGSGYVRIRPRSVDVYKGNARAVPHPDREPQYSIKTYKSL